MKLCSKCKYHPSLSYHVYCYACLRISRGQNIIAKYRRDSSNKSMCSGCKQNPKLPYHRYCQECKNASTAAWMRKEGGSWKRLIRLGQRNKGLATAAVKKAISCGKLIRLPCEVCGDAKSQGHHHRGYERQFWLDVKWLCAKHHTAAHKIMQNSV
jgi:hypothetical protein